MSTHRSPDGAFAGPGAVRQHGGSVPIYVCDNDGTEVVWLTAKSGRNYLANISHGYNGHRYYIGANVHDCGAILARRADDADRRERADEELHHAQYRVHLVTMHEIGKHAGLTIPLCSYCGSPRRAEFDSGLEGWRESEDGKAAVAEAIAEAIGTALD